MGSEEAFGASTYLRIDDLHVLLHLNGKILNHANEEYVCSFVPVTYPKLRPAYDWVYDCGK